MPFIIQEEWFTKEQIRANPDTYFVFGDNEQRFGTGGQAKPCRGEPNCIGVRTKRWPSNHPDSFWTDICLDSNKEMIKQDFKAVVQALKAGKTVIFPASGIGTGMSDLERKAPSTLLYIYEWIVFLKENFSE